MTLRTYAIVGLGHRSTMYLNALVGAYAGDGRLVGLCDINPGRLAHAAGVARAAGVEVATYGAEAFDAMVADQSPDRVIVTVPDRLHADYIERALDLGCDVVTEKPLTVDAPSCLRIIAARKRTGRAITVGFNYRYSPVRTLFKQVLMSGIVGHVTGGSFEWLLDTYHGADYFRRWHRDKANSGGLFVHKATHHFDLLNWWLAGVPKRVTASGRRVFYRPGMAEALGLGEHGPRCTGCPVFDRCGFRLDLDADPHLRALYRENEAFDGYYRDRCVFDAETNIEDQMNAIIEFEGGIVMNYRLTAFNPREGYRVVFDGTRGRAVLTNVERGHVNPDGSPVRPKLEEVNRITVQPHFGREYELALPEAKGTHGGGDAAMLGEIFGRPGNDQFGRVADERAGTLSAAVGAAANASLLAGGPVVLTDLIPDMPDPEYPRQPFGPDQVWTVFEEADYPFLAGAKIV